MPGHRHHRRARAAAAEARAPAVEGPAGEANSDVVARMPAPAPAAPTVLEAAAPEVPFVRRSAREKMGVMTGVMDDARGMLDANGVSPQVESRIAATIPQELSPNDARRGLGYTFLKEARALKTALKDVDPNDAATDALKLTEEQRFLLGRVRTGEVDLSLLPADLGETPASVRDPITEAGIALRSSQYGEMSELRRQKKDAKLDKPQAARLAKLEGTRGLGMRYNGYDPSMGDLHGLSSARFGEIFAEGNSRFEPVQYRRLRDSYGRNKASHDAAAAAAIADPKRKPPGETVAASAGIGDFDVSPRGQARLAENADLLADIATSYGPGQIMGGYGGSEDFRGRTRGERLAPIREADGTERTPSLEELKASGTRMTPTADDVRPMLGLVKMKGIDLGGAPTVPEWISAYNGNPNPAQRQQYTHSLDTNGALYDAARARTRPPGETRG